MPKVLEWSSEPGEGLAICGAKAVPSSLGYFETLKIGPAPGFEPATFLSAVQLFTNWTNPDAFCSLKYAL